LRNCSLRTTTTSPAGVVLWAHALEAEADAHTSTSAQTQEQSFTLLIP
jgi:hypothetical protein